MAYGRKGAKRFPKKGGKRVSKLVVAQNTAIGTLAKAVRGIQLKMKRKSVFINYGQQFDTDLSSDYNYFNLSNYNSYSRIFGSSSDDEQSKKMIHKSFGLDLYFNSSSEPNAINFTVFLVSLKDTIRGSAFDNNSGGLSLTNNVDYYTKDGFTLLNKDCFNIHSIKRFTLGNNGVGLGSSTAQTQYGTDRRIYMKMRCNKTVLNPNGNWHGLNCSPDASDNYYLLVFNDNGILDAENPRMRGIAVHTLEQLS